MAQVGKCVAPFGEVNVHTTNRNVWRVTATILMEPRREGTQTGIALDGSSSMRLLYGLGSSPVNQVTVVAQRICSYPSCWPPAKSRVEPFHLVGGQHDG